MAKPIPTTKPTRKPKNNTKHQRGDKNGLKLTGPFISMMPLSFYSLIQVYRYRPTSPEYLSIMLLALAWDVGGVCLEAGRS
jgi:hypothetical protein